MTTRIVNLVTKARLINEQRRILQVAHQLRDQKPKKVDIQQVLGLALDALIYLVEREEP